MVNKVTLIGNLGADPEVRRLENGVAVAKIRIATNENYKDRTSGEWVTQTEWHNVVLWRYLAERAEQSLKRGKLVYIEGKLTTRKWQDQDGNDRYATEVVANVMRLLERREGSGGSGYSSSFPDATSAPPPASFEANNPAPTAVNTSTTTAATTTETTEVSETTEVAKDDLPF